MWMGNLWLGNFVYADEANAHFLFNAYCLENRLLIGLLLSLKKYCTTP
jgi:hypothetical protein